MKQLLVLCVSPLVVTLLIVLIVLFEPRGEAFIEPERHTGEVAAVPASAEVGAVTAAVLEQTERAAERVEVAADEPAPDSRHDLGRGPGQVSIVVRDHLGLAAAGVPLIAIVQRGGEAPRTVWRGESDARGAAVAGPFESSVDVAATSVEVVALSPFAAPPRAQFRLDALPAEPIVLTLPPHGAVDVELDYPDPTRLEGVLVRLDVDDHEELDRMDPTVSAQGGRAAFEHVGLGLRMRATARFKTGQVSAESSFDGPVGHGQRVRVRLSLGQGRRILVADLEDEHGEPLRSAGLSVAIRAKHEGSSSSRSFRAESAADGRLYLEIMDAFPATAQRSLRLTREGESTHTIELELPPLHPGENHLGVLTLRPPQHLCSGTVVDRSGAPITGASIDVQSRPAAHPEAAWRNTDIQRVTSSADGAFLVRGQIRQAEQYALAVGCPGFVPLAGVPFAAGAEGLQLVLDRAATLRGQVLFDVGLWNPWRFRVEVRRPDTDAIADLNLAADGRFTFDEIAPGAVELRVFVHGDPVPLFERALRIDVAAETVLEAIDLRGRLHRIVFHVVDRDGNPVREASAMLMHDRSLSPRLEGLLLEGGRGETVARTEAVEVLAFASDYRVARVPALRDGDRIVLESASEVVVTLAPPVVAPTGLSLLVRLQRFDAVGSDFEEYVLRGERQTRTTIGGEPPWAAESTAIVGADGTAAIRVAEPGSYRVCLDLLAHRRTRSCPVIGDPVIEITAHDTRQTIEVAVLEAVITAAAAALARESR